MAQLPGVSHIALTVTDLAVSDPWYERLLDTKPVLDEDTDDLHHTVYLLPGGTLLALHQHHTANGGSRFDERSPDLDHLSFGVANRDELKAWQSRLRGSGSRMEGSSTPTTATACRSATPTTSPWNCSHLPGRPLADWSPP